MSIASKLLPVYRTSELRSVEAAAKSAPLMERAGAAAADVARSMIGERGGSILVLAGPGNNGGDAFVAARRLRQAFFDVVVTFRNDPAGLPPDAAAAHRAYAAAAASTRPDIPAHWRGSLVIDGLFGIGLTRPLSTEYAAMVEWANMAGTPILALDVPSGLAAETGVALEPAIRATATATFIALKPGLLTGDGVDLCGYDFGTHARTRRRGHRTGGRPQARLARPRRRPAGDSGGAVRETCTREASAHWPSSAVPTAWLARRSSQAELHSTPAPARCGSASSRPAGRPSTGVSRS